MNTVATALALRPCFARRADHHTDGIGWLPTFLARQTPGTDALVGLLPQLKPSPIPVYAIFPGRRSASPKVRAFVNFLAEALAAPEALHGPGERRSLPAGNRA